MKAVCEQSLIRGWSHFFYGGAPGVAELLAGRLQQQFPGINIVGWYTPPFRELTSEEDKNILREIYSVKPNIIWVGLSTPKQERWMASHVDNIPGTTLIGVGAAFDFLSGTKKQAPLWIQRSGTEWLFRLITEPRRLWRRYIGYPRFVLLVLLQLFGIKRYDSV
jgi:N-acetylglucosaminyldiphosphoundecaprenol N-acetyl-beta-D-mannosaminyltransferase